jgi:hypothetical protein
MAFAVNVEIRTLENPDRTAVQNVKTTFRYVKGKQDIGIRYTSPDSETVKLEALVMLIMQAMKRIGRV